ncbi:MAG: threonine synthase [Oscillospiraceae bacterium]|nr:threonine synthase [Oscillospiraceae bacterium]
MSKDYMIYQSTRGCKTVSPSAAVLKGIAEDGGLYIMKDMDKLSFDWQACLKLNTIDKATMILSALLPDYENMAELTERAYRGRFETDDLTPVVKVGEDFVLELFRGPTSAFKDVALSMLPQLITAARKQENVTDKIVILTATSGDTGKAALEGFHDVDGTGIIVFYPDGGVSPVQRAQMATQSGNNVKVCAVKGNFDDCQRGVKETFAKDSAEQLLEGKGVRLSSANSINIGRLAPQVVYYFVAYSELLSRGEIALGDKIDFVVPTGNFGDILAGYFAKLMGLPVGRLVCASNANNVLTDFLNTGVYDRRRPFLRTTSPSMDILVSSNLERMLYLAAGGDTEKVKGYMEELSANGVYQISAEELARIRETYSAGFCSEEETGKTIGKVWKEHSYLCDTHTAVAMTVCAEYKKSSEYTGSKVVVLSTASPFKFPAAVLQAIGGNTEGDEFEQMEELSRMTGVPVPANLSGLKARPVLHKDLTDRDTITEYVMSQIFEV